MSHAFDRCRERYGIELTHDEISDIARSIRLGLPTSILLRHERRGGLLYAVHVRGQWLAAVRKSDRIVTFRPRCALEPFFDRIYSRQKELRQAQAKAACY